MRAAPSLFTRVADDCAELTVLLARLEDEVPEKKRNPHGGYGSGKGGHHSPAWNGPAAMLVMDIHFGVRELETNLKYQISGRVRSRGTSDGNTQRALGGLAGLCAGADYAAGKIVLAKLESWCYRARLVLGDADPVSRLPRLPGQGEPSCPFCRCPGTLRVRHATGVVMCLRPSCRAQGRIEVGSFSNEPLIAWPDGTTGVLPPAALCCQPCRPCVKPAGCWCRMSTWASIRRGIRT